MYYRHIFRAAPFRLFWIGFTVSVLGDALSRVAFTWYVYDLTRSPEALGWLMLCYTGPIIIGGLMAGWLLDRFDRRKVMIVDNIVRGLVMACVPLLHALDMLTIWHIYAVAAIYGLLMMISLAGGPSLIPSLVHRDQLETANALETLSFTLGGVLGPPLAGVLIASVGAPYAIILDAISYFIFAVSLWRIRPADVSTDGIARHRRSEATETGVAHDSPVAKTHTLGDAVRLLLCNPVLLSTTVMFLVFNIGGGGLLSVWLPVLTDQVLGGGAALFGFLLGVMSAGEVVSSVIASSAYLPFSLGRRICIAQALSGLALLLVLAQDIALVAIGLALFGAFSAPLTIWAQTLRMYIIPESLRGRAFALLRMLMQSGNPLGGALAAVIVPALGVTASVLISALLVGVPGVVGFRVRSLREAGSALP
jgi:MFS family permease